MQRPDNLPMIRERSRSVHLRERASLLRQPEIQQLDALFGHQNVRRLQISMRDASLVSGIQRIQNLTGKLDGFFERQRPFQWSALDVLHHQIVWADVVQRADVRVIQRRHNASLALEPVSESSCATLMATHAIESGVPRLPHFSHAPRADRRENFVGAEFVTHGNWHEDTSKFSRSREVDRNG